MATELIDAAMSEVAAEERLFELAQRKAKVYSGSELVPDTYRNNIGNVMIADNMARRMGADTLMVMQNLFVVKGRPSWSSQFLIACFNSCGRFSAIKYRFSGKAWTDDWGCVAHCTEVATGEAIEGTRITLGMAKAEKWGPKWQTMPEQMLRYRSASFLIRTTAPEIGMGLLTKEEVEDMPVDALSVRPSVTPESLRSKLAPRQTEPEAEELPETSYEPQQAEPLTMTLVDEFRVAASEVDTPKAVATLTENWIGPDSTRELTQEDVEAIQNIASERIAELRGKK